MHSGKMQEEENEDGGEWADVGGLFDTCDLGEVSEE